MKSRYEFPAGFYLAIFDDESQKMVVGDSMTVNV